MSLNPWKLLMSAKIAKTLWFLVIFSVIFQKTVYWSSNARINAIFCRNILNGPNDIYLYIYLGQISLLSVFLDLKVMYYM